MAVKGGQSAITSAMLRPRFCTVLCEIYKASSTGVNGIFSDMAFCTRN